LHATAGLLLDLRYNVHFISSIRNSFVHHNQSAKTETSLIFPDGRGTAPRRYRYAVYQIAATMPQPPNGKKTCHNRLMGNRARNIAVAWGCNKSGAGNKYCTPSATVAAAPYTHAGDGGYQLFA
jgi:hypothetical protein